MIVIRHCKNGDMKYVSHKDTLRVLQRALKRAKIDVAYSKGFVPHMLTYTTTPLPLGVASEAEYFTVDCQGIDAGAFLQAFNQALPQGLRGDWSKEVDKNPNLAYMVTASRYRIDAGEDARRVKEIMSSDQYIIEIARKGEKIVKDVRDMIFDVDVDGNYIFATLATGNVNLRVDSFAESLNERFGLSVCRDDVVREEQLVSSDGGLVSAKEFLS
ncbi:MAG: TIGR03936 family radical SAM-associated protein [Christensenellales bacterium]